MSEQEESEFLEPWARLAKEGRLLVLSPIRAALAQRLGRPVLASVVYRLLERHGRHPAGIAISGGGYGDSGKLLRRFVSPCRGLRDQIRAVDRLDRR